MLVGRFEHARECITIDHRLHRRRVDLAMRDEPCDRLVERLKRTVARLVVQQASCFSNATVGTVRDVVPGYRGFFRCDGGAPLLPRQEAQARLAAKPARDRFRVPA